MANIFTPFGFRPLRRIDGAAWTANQTPYQIAAANAHKFFAGDPVTLLSTGFIDVLTPGTTQIAGIFVGCAYFSTALGRTNPSLQFPGGDTTQNVTAFIIDDPNATFLVQVGTTVGGNQVGGPAVQADVGANFNFAFGTGSTATGLSGAFLDYSTRGPATSTLPFRIVNLNQTPYNGQGFPPGYNGSDGTTAGNFVEVAFNNQNFKSLTGI